MVVSRDGDKARVSGFVRSKQIQEPIVFPNYDEARTTPDAFYDAIEMESGL